MLNDKTYIRRHPVRVRRRRLKLSQVELAEKSGVDRVAISNMENGVSIGYRNDTIAKLAAVFGVTPAKVRLEIYEWLAEGERIKIRRGIQ